MSAAIFKAYNSETRKHEEVDLELGEFFIGDRAVKMFWCNRAKKHVTIPGASLYVLTADGWQLTND